MSPKEVRAALAAAPAMLADIPASTSEARKVTLTIIVNANGSVTSDVQTHDNSYADVAVGLGIVRDEINRVFDEAKSCPYYPKTSADANKKISRAAIPAKEA